MNRKFYIIFTIIGFCWGVWGGYFIRESKLLVFGWLPISVLSICLTGIYASLINYLYFFRKNKG